MMSSWPAGQDPERAKRTTTPCAGRGLFRKLKCSLLLFIFTVGTTGTARAGATSGTQIRIEPRGLSAFASSRSGESFSAPLNESFTLKISVEGTDEKPGEISIAGLDNFRQLSSRTSSSIQFVNGRRSSTYNYDLELMPNGEGIFSLGPAMAKINEERIESNQLQMHVSRGASKAKGRNQAGQQNENVCFAEIETSNTTPFTWESFMVTLRIWAHEEKVHDVQVEDLQFDGFETKKLVSGQRRASKNGTSYSIVETQYLFTPTKAGKKPVGPVTVHYRAQVAGDNGDPFFDDLFHGFFGRGMRGKEGRIRTEPIEISVKEIPKSAKNTSGIGNFSALTIHTDKQKVEAHEPLKVKLFLSGEGNFEQIDTPKLKIPQKWKSYNSSSKFTQNGTAVSPKNGIKEFEYIVQIPTAGTHTIPKQTFTYFDTQTERVETAETESVQIEVLPGSHDSNQPLSDDDASNDESRHSSLATADDSSSRHSESENDRLPNTSGVGLLEGYVKQENNKPAGLGWQFFFLIVSFPLFGLAFWKGYRFYSKRKNPKSELKKRLKMLTALEAKGDLENLYKFIISFCVNILDGKENAGETWILKKLVKIGIPPGKVDNFSEFLSNAAAHSFGFAKTDNRNLFTEARLWIEVITKFIQRKS